MNLFIIVAAGLGDQSMIDGINGSIGELLKNFAVAFAEIINKGDLFFWTPIQQGSNKTWTFVIGTFGLNLLPALLLSIEWMKQLTEFRIERIEDGIRFGLKAVVAKMIVENSHNLALGLYQTFKPDSVTTTDAIEKMANAFTDGRTLNDGGVLGLNYLLACFMQLIVLLVLTFMLIKILIQIVGIRIEITVLMLFSAPAVACLISSETRGIGVHYIKNVITTTLQLAIISAAFSLYTPIADIMGTFTNVGGAFNGTVIGFVLCCIGPILTLSVWSTAITKATEITKTAFGG